MRHQIKIGEIIFDSKKAALNHFKTILNNYDFGESLNGADFQNVYELLNTHPERKDKIGKGLKEIRIAKLKYNTRCFELVRIDDTTDYFSYTKRINSPPSDFTRFLTACRETIQDDLRSVKQSYFDKYSKNGKVKCQETGEFLKWEELNVDHRQPNTFSVIVDRFIELHQINLCQIEFVEVDGFQDKLANNKLREDFRQYHRKKANLRVVKRNMNLGRSHQAKIIRQKKDLTIE